MQELLKKMTYGYYVVTAIRVGSEGEVLDEENIAAATVNWASQVSFEPVMLAISIEEDSHLNEIIDYSGYFTVHLLADDHKEYIEKFAGKTKVENGKINGVPFNLEDGEVVIEGALGYIKCELKESVRAGDHTLQVGEALEVKMLKDKKAICTMELPIQYTEESSKA